MTNRHACECRLFTIRTNDRASASNDRFPKILLKNTVLLMQKISIQTQRERFFYQALLVCCGAGNTLASLRLFSIPVLINLRNQIS